MSHFRVTRVARIAVLGSCPLPTASVTTFGPSFSFRLTNGGRSDVNSSRAARRNLISWSSDRSVTSSSRSTFVDKVTVFISFDGESPSTDSLGCSSEASTNAPWAPMSFPRLPDGVAVAWMGWLKWSSNFDDTLSVSSSDLATSTCSGPVVVGNPVWLDEGALTDGTALWPFVELGFWDLVVIFRFLTALLTGDSMGTDSSDSSLPSLLPRNSRVVLPPPETKTYVYIYVEDSFASTNGKQETRRRIVVRR